MDLLSPRRTPFAQRPIRVAFALQGFGELAHGSVTGYRGVPTDSEEALMSAVTQQHDRLGDNSLLCGRDEVSLAKCMEVPESCSAGVDEMREMASTIKTEVLARAVCDAQKVAPNSLGLYRLQNSDESG